MTVLTLAPAGVIRFVHPTQFANLGQGVDLLELAPNNSMPSILRRALTEGTSATDGPLDLGGVPGLPRHVVLVRKAIFAPASGPNDTFGQPSQAAASCGALCAYNNSTGKKFWGERTPEERSAGRPLHYAPTLGSHMWGCLQHCAWPCYRHVPRSARCHLLHHAALLSPPRSPPCPSPCPCDRPHAPSRICRLRLRVRLGGPAPHRLGPAPRHARLPVRLRPGRPVRPGLPVPPGGSQRGQGGGNRTAAEVPGASACGAPGGGGGVVPRGGQAGRMRGSTVGRL